MRSSAEAPRGTWNTLLREQSHSPFSRLQYNSAASGLLFLAATGESSAGLGRLLGIQSTAGRRLASTSTRQVAKHGHRHDVPNAINTEGHIW